MVGMPDGRTLERLVVFLSFFATATILLCGFVVVAHSQVNRWQVFTERLVGLAQQATRHWEGSQADAPDDFMGFREGVVFGVGYTKDGSLVGNEGICPNPSQIAWLEEFKSAITACGSRAGQPLRLNVRGFASVAPVALGDAGSSDDGNLEIANRRGRAIARFLADDSSNFETCNPNSGAICPPDNETADGDCLAQDGNYIVRYRDWPDYRTMRRFSLVNDGGRPTPRYRMEFLNRTVHIAVMNDACWRSVDGI